jgi:carboxylesterase
LKRKNKEILPGAGPFYFRGNNTGVILIHGGGGGTCADLKPLAEDLHSKGGFTIILPLLPGYGTNPQDLRNIQIENWKSVLYNEFCILRDRCDKIFVGGHSMGGVLTLLLAANYNLDGIFTISAPIGIQNVLFYLVPFFKIFIKYHSIDSEKFVKDTKGKWVGYSKIPLNIATKLKSLMKEMKLSLKKIHCPALIFQGKNDSEIKKQSMEYIFNNIKSKKKKKVWLPNNDHPILESPDHEQIVSELFKFLNELCT